MKVNFNQPFLDPFGNPCFEEGASKPTIVSRNFGMILYNVGDKQIVLTPEEKYLAFKISVKIANAEGEVEISQEEANLIDKIASRIYSAGAYGFIKNLITNK